MKDAGERFLPEQTGIIALEHFNRYFFVINQIDLSNKVLLDIASGEGYGSNLLAQYAKLVYGVDLSNEAIEHARNRYKRTNLVFKQGNAISIPLDDKSIDVVVSFETIEHHTKHHEMIKEIQRVLKEDGVLVISSPDKLNYSDLPNVKNKFHLKELYYHEFKELISNNFIKSIFYNQKVFEGSIIALDENSGNYSKPLVIDKEGKSYEFTPVYNLAIGTNKPDFIPKYQLILYKESDKIIIDEDLENIKESLINSSEYKIGSLIIKPFRLIKKSIRFINHYSITLMNFINQLSHHKSIPKPYYRLFIGKSGIEIGGPSNFFSESVNIYSIIKSLDGVNFSSNTVCEIDIIEGQNYKWRKHRTGFQYICDMVNLDKIESSKYDFVLSYNKLEHIANPFKAINEMLRIIKPDGLIFLVLPAKEHNFDHNRQVTGFDHLLTDYTNNVSEDDLTHLDEILKLHDLSLDPPAGNFENFKNRSLNNFQNRCLHHHVFDMQLLKNIFSYFNLKILISDKTKTDFIIVGKKCTSIF